MTYAHINRTAHPVTRAVAHPPLSSGIACQPAVQKNAAETPAPVPERQLPEQPWPVFQRKAANGAVIQRMIRMELFAQRTFEEIKDLNTLLRFISYGELEDGSFQFVNNRAQSFKQAVNEFIKTKSPRYGEVEERWKWLLAATDVEKIKACMREIATVINRVKSEYPDHPNAFWIGQGAGEMAAEEEAPGTIPQTTESRDLANGLLYELNAEDGKLKKAVLEGTIGHEKKQKMNFMLGVLVFPDRQVMISVSGGIKNFSMLERFCDDYLRGRDFILKGVYNTAHLTEKAREQYEASYSKEVGGSSTSFNKAKGDEGSMPGACAAAVILGNKDVMNPQSFRERKPSERGKGKVRLGLTEVFTGDTVEISNRKQGAVQQWPKPNTNEFDIPSCETCQHQLLHPALELVRLEKAERLKYHYPDRQQSIAAKLTTYEAPLLEESARKESTDKQYSDAAAAAAAIKKELEKLHADKKKELSEQGSLLHELERKLYLIEENERGARQTVGKAVKLCNEYLTPKKNNSRAPATVWNELRKLVPAMSDVSSGDRKARAEEYIKTAKNNDKESDAAPLRKAIADLQTKMSETKGAFIPIKADYQQKEAEMTHFKEESLKQEQAIGKLKEEITYWQSKLERYDHKIRRDEAALKQLKEPSDAKKSS
jgi:hypothetical protein